MWGGGGEKEWRKVRESTNVDTSKSSFGASPLSAACCMDFLQEGSEGLHPVTFSLLCTLLPSTAKGKGEENEDNE